jgi:two-component system C4-dicarboxylate transport sensor histidine kinase DctB
MRNVSLILAAARQAPAQRLGAAPTPIAPGTYAPGSARVIDDDVLRQLETVDRGLKQMATLVRRWMGRPSDVAALHQETRTLGQTIEHATRLLHAAAMMRRINIAVRVSAAAAQLPAGPVYPIIANALRNAIEAIGEDFTGADNGGTIEVAAAMRADQVELTISDNGPGLAPALLDAQGHFCFGRTSKPDGHGLGLMLCRDIAAKMGGELELTNRLPRGTTLRLRYPVCGLR